MILVALKGLLQRKLRALLTAMAVVLGVAMVSGTFMLTDSIEEAFDSIFESSYAETDAVISGKPLVEHSSSGNPIVPAALLERVRALPGVDEAAGSIADLQNGSNVAQVLDPDGKVIGGAGAASLGLGIDPDAPRFNPLQLSDGDWPRGSGEVVLDAATAKSHDFAVGDRVGVVASGPRPALPRSRALRSTATSSRSAAPRSRSSTSQTAQRLFRKDGYDSISVAGREGTTAAAVIEQIKPLLGPTTKVQTGAASAAADSKEVFDLHLVPPLRAARIWRHRAVRRRLRHLQHALDHRGAAHARVRDTAHARRFAPAGARLGHARDVRDRLARIARRPRPRARALARPASSCSANSASVCRRREPSSRRAPSSSRSRSASSSR